MSSLKEEDCEGNLSLTGSSHSCLRTVLVTVRIDKPSAKHIKRVRFNSLVEVKFIPRRRKKDKKLNKIDDEEGKEEKMCAGYVPENSADCTNNVENEVREVDFKGVVSVSEKWIATETDTVSAMTTDGSNRNNSTHEPDWERVEEPLNKSSPPVIESDSSMAKNVGNEEVHENTGKASTHTGVKSRTTFRQSYTTSKITLGTDYIGNALRLTPTKFPISPPIQFSDFPARNARKQNLYEFGPKEVWRLEKQAARFCQEAQALITQVTEKNAHIQSKLKERSDTVRPCGNYRQTLLNEYASFRKPASVPDLTTLGKQHSLDRSYSVHGNGGLTGGKPVTRFPYIKNKKQQSIMGLNRKSSSELCLPHLLLYDGNGARNPGALAKPDGKRESVDQRDSELEKSQTGRG